MIKRMPSYFFSGHRGGESDRQFIIDHLERLNPTFQKQAVEEYEKIYFYHYERKEYQLAREAANTFLANFTDENGGVVVHSSDKKPSADTKGKIAEMINRAKAAQKKSQKTILGMADALKK